MTVTYLDGIYSLDQLDFEINEIKYSITGTHKVENHHGYYYIVEFKAVETNQQYTMRHHTLCEKILKSQEK